MTEPETTGRNMPDRINRQINRAVKDCVDQLVRGESPDTASLALAIVSGQTAESIADLVKTEQEKRAESQKTDAEKVRDAADKAAGTRVPGAPGEPLDYTVRPGAADKGDTGLVADKHGVGVPPGDPRADPDFAARQGAGGMPVKPEVPAKEEDQHKGRGHHKK